MSSQAPVSDQSDKSLYDHEVYLHTPTNVNEAHAQEYTGLNDRIAVFLTRNVGSMPMAYAFVVLACIGLLAILGWLSPLVALLVAWLSQTMIQLVMLPILLVAQNVLSRHSEIQADEQFSTTQKVYHDIEQIAQHLSAQDAELLRHRALLGECKEASLALHAQMEELTRIIAMYEHGKWFVTDMQERIDKLIALVDAQKGRNDPHTKGGQ